jgi:hypothetical protein
LGIFVCDLTKPTRPRSQADTDAALALKADSSALSWFQSSVALDLQTKANQTSVEALSGYVSSLEPAFVAQAPLVKGVDEAGARLLGIPSYSADLSAKADAANVYTKAQVDESLAQKASVASVTDGLGTKADQTSLDVSAPSYLPFSPHSRPWHRWSSTAMSCSWMAPPCRWASSGSAHRMTP